MKPFGLLGALLEEIDALLIQLENPVIERVGMRDFIRGRLEGRDCVAVYSRIGKTAAASTTATLIDRFGVGEILFCGVAGAIEPGLKQGDIVIGREFVQWDLDARPLFPYSEVPLLGISRFKSDDELTARLARAVARATREAPPSARTPIVVEGVMATGDRFLASRAEVENLRSLVPDAKCVDMETAAVAQVCYEHGVPLAAFRILSDGADESAAEDFTAFLRDQAGPLAAQVAVGFLREPA